MPSFVKILVGHFVKSAFPGDGYGLFKGNPMAVRFARTMSKAQIRKFKQYGIVPGAFYAYLRAIGAIGKDIPICASSLDELVRILRFYRGGKNQAKSAWDCLLGEIQKNIPILPDSSSAAHIWIKLETYGILRGKRIIFPKN